MNFAPYTTAEKFFGHNTPHRLSNEFGTPLYVYNENILRQRCRELLALSDIPGFKVNYSVKANANLTLLKIIKEEGLVVDAMSPGELYIDILAGYNPDEITYISNNNTADEMMNAIAHNLLISVDSLDQLDLLGQLSPAGRVMVRINPGIGQGHSEKVITAGNKTKFGIMPEDLPKVLELVQQYGLTLCGLNHHIGSLFMEPGGYVAAAKVLLDLAATLPKDILSNLEVIDFGGGFGIPYHKHDNEARLDMQALGHSLTELLSAWRSAHNYEGRFLIEPGRYVVAESGALLGQITATKFNGQTHYVGTDLGFNVLMRPVLYDSYHEIEVYPKNPSDEEPFPQTVTGNICESGDILARDRMLPKLTRGDFIVLLDAGAYGYSMSSCYNQRQRPAEVLINSEGQAKLIRRRESLSDLTACFNDLD